MPLLFAFRVFVEPNSHKQEIVALDNDLFVKMYCHFKLIVKYPLGILHREFSKLIGLQCV